MKYSNFNLLLILKKLFLNFLDKEVLATLYDTAGQEEFARLRKVAYEGADVFIIIFDLTNPDSFENATKKVNFLF